MIGRRGWTWLLACGGLALAVGGGCRRAAPEVVEAARDVTERGPFRLVVEAVPRQARVGDVITVSLTVHAPEEHIVRFPGAESFGELGAREYPAGEPLPGDTGLVWNKKFALEPLVSGALEIPPLAVQYARRQGDTETQPADEHELVSNALTLDVKSVLTSTDKPETPRDITGTLTPPRAPLPAWVWVVAGAGLIVGGAGAALLVRYLVRRAQRPPPPILPEVWALRALAELESYDWFAWERAREFYYRLTQIVRVYIERKFGLAAPEMTTEEFLLLLARERSSLPYDAERLRAFLEACDVVKYAALHPHPDDARQVLNTARAFVHTTAAASAAAPPVAGGQAA